MPAVPASVLGAVATAFLSAGIDLAALGLACGRLLPIVILVPAFRLRALPAPARAAHAPALGAAVGPAVGVAGAGSARCLLDEVTRGLSVANTAAVAHWAATMTGGV